MAGVAKERSEEPGGRDPAPGKMRSLQLFMNTRNLEADTELFDEPAAVSRWLTEQGLSAELNAVKSDVDLERVVDLRESLRGLLTASHDHKPPPTDDIEAIAAAATAGSLTVDVDLNALRVVPTGDDLDAALARIVLIAVEASLLGDWRRLKVCSNDGCRWVFWDGSRNRSGRWCTMALCGNQAKVRSHRRRTTP